jgi:hypothetical protein
MASVPHAAHGIFLEPVSYATGGWRAGAPHAPTRASSVELLLQELGARLILQELHLLLEFELSELLLAAQEVWFPFDGVQFQGLLHTMELVLKLELVHLLLRLVQLLRAWLCGETGATGCLVPQLVALPLRVREVLGAREILKLFTLGECVEVLLLGRVRPLLAERVGGRPAGGVSQKQHGQQKTCRHGPAQCHRRTSVVF